MSGPRVVYKQHPAATRQSEISALAAVYAFVLDRHANKKTTHLGGPDDDAKKFEGRRLCQTKM